MTVETLARMDELPDLSFTTKCSPKTQIYAQQGTANGSVDRHGAVSKTVSRGVSCTTCGQTFIAEHLLRLHQKVSNCNNSALQSLLLAGGGDKNQPNIPGSHTQHGRVNNFSGHCTRNQKRLYQAFAQTKARTRHAVKRLPKWDDSRPLVAFWASKRPRTASPERHPSSSVSQGEFMGQCGLITSSRAVDIKCKPDKPEDVDLDCQIEAMAGPVCGEALQSPRTTRSLMSQFSREHAETVRKRLSFCLDSEDQEGSENETLDSAAARRSVQVSLLAIDFSSPLGQRLKKHMKADLVVPPITDIEQHCMTIPVLDEMAAKLRHRANEYPIMHRKRKGIVTGYSHTFKFNKAERREFLRTLKTGLNARSRRLLRQTKKSAVRLTRLRAEVIRYWTIKRRTIVNEEITIDDDLSIVQVDVPEHLFNAVRKKAVPFHRPMHYRGQVIDGKYFPSQGAYSVAYPGMAGAGHRQLPSHSQHLTYPYPSSSVGPSSSTQGPVPQFLVKQVNKSWTENGQESQKLVFVPLDETGPSQQHPSLPTRNVAGGSAHRSFPPSSSGIKKSLPRHLRPCPKSQRKHRPQQQQEDEDFVIETASSSSSDDDRSSSRACKPKESKEGDVYPLSLSSTREMMSSSSWAMSEGPVPQMLHVANSASAGVPVSGLMSFPAGMVPVSPWEHHMEAMAAGGLKASQMAYAPGCGMPSEAVDHHSELRKHLTIFGPGSAKPMGEEAGDQRSLAHHSVGIVHRASDHHKQQASSSRRAAPVQQPNFLQLPPDPPKLYDPSARDHQPKPQTAGHQSTAHSHANMPRLVQGSLQLPISSAKQSILARHSSGHLPNILRGHGKMQNSTSGAKTDNEAKLPPNKPLSTSDWTVIRASDDDVVEIICIDDD